MANVSLNERIENIISASYWHDINKMQILLLKLFSKIIDNTIKKENFPLFRRKPFPIIRTGSPLFSGRNHVPNVRRRSARRNNISFKNGSIAIPSGSRSECRERLSQKDPSKPFFEIVFCLRFPSFFPWVFDLFLQLVSACFSASESLS